MTFLDFLKKLFKVESTPRIVEKPVNSEPPFKLVDVERKLDTRVGNPSKEGDEPFKLVDVERKPSHKSRGGKRGHASSTSLKDLDVDTVLAWSKRYDEEHPWWVQEETRLGEILRSRKEFDTKFLLDVVDWKFKEVEGRRILNRERVLTNDAELVKHISRRALQEGIADEARVKELRKISGVGVATASVILTFNDPERYCVFGIHVWRELYGKEPSTIFTLNRHYLHMLEELRDASKRLGLPVRTIEKALFKKNLVKGRSLDYLA